MTSNQSSQQMLVVNTMNNHESTINIYRYKLSIEMIDKLYQFSKIHEYDNRKDFKEAWTLWAEENNEFISHELRRLRTLGYNGNIDDKLFKSARYYFRKKNTEKKKPAKRRNYIGTQKKNTRCYG